MKAQVISKTLSLILGTYMAIVGMIQDEPTKVFMSGVLLGQVTIFYGRQGD